MWLSSCICVAPSHLAQVEARVLENPGPNLPHRSLKVENLFSAPLCRGSTSAPVGGARWKDRRPSGPSLTLTVSIHFPGTHTCPPPPNTLDILNAEDVYLYGIDKE